MLADRSLDSDPMWRQLLSTDRTFLEYNLLEATSYSNSNNVGSVVTGGSGYHHTNHNQNISGGGRGSTTLTAHNPPIRLQNIKDQSSLRGTLYALGALTAMRRTMEFIVRSGRVALPTGVSTTKRSGGGADPQKTGVENGVPTFHGRSGGGTSPSAASHQAPSFHFGPFGMNQLPSSSSSKNKKKSNASSSKNTKDNNMNNKPTTGSSGGGGGGGGGGLENINCVRDPRILHIDPADGLMLLAGNEEIRSVYDSWWLCLVGNEYSRKEEQKYVISHQQHRNVTTTTTTTTTNTTSEQQQHHDEQQENDDDDDGIAAGTRTPTTVGISKSDNPNHPNNPAGTPTTHTNTNANNIPSSYRLCSIYKEHYMTVMMRITEVLTLVEYSNSNNNNNGGGGGGGGVTNHHHHHHHYSGVLLDGQEKKEEEEEVFKHDHYLHHHEPMHQKTTDDNQAAQQQHHHHQEDQDGHHHHYHNENGMMPENSHHSNSNNNNNISHINPALRALIESDWIRDSKGRNKLSYEGFFTVLFCISCNWFVRKHGSWVDPEAIQHHVKFLQDLFLVVFSGQLLESPHHHEILKKSKNSTAGNASVVTLPVLPYPEVVKRTVEENKKAAVRAKKRRQKKAVAAAAAMLKGGGQQSSTTVDDDSDDLDDLENEGVDDEEEEDDDRHYVRNMIAAAAAAAGGNGGSTISFLGVPLSVPTTLPQEAHVPGAYLNLVNSSSSGSGGKKNMMSGGVVSFTQQQQRRVMTPSHSLNNNKNQQQDFAQKSQTPQPPIISAIINNNSGNIDSSHLHLNSAYKPAKLKSFTVLDKISGSFELGEGGRTQTQSFPVRNFYNAHHRLEELVSTHQAISAGPVVKPIVGLAAGGLQSPLRNVSILGSGEVRGRLMQGRIYKPRKIISHQSHPQDLYNTHGSSSTTTSKQAAITTTSSLYDFQITDCGYPSSAGKGRPG